MEGWSSAVACVGTVRDSLVVRAPWYNHTLTRFRRKAEWQGWVARLHPSSWYQNNLSPWGCYTYNKLLSTRCNKYPNFTSHQLFNLIACTCPIPNPHDKEREYGTSPALPSQILLNNYHHTSTSVSMYNILLQISRRTHFSRDNSSCLGQLASY